MANINWRKNSATVTSKNFRRQKEFPANIDFDFDKLNISRGGLLESLLHEGTQHYDARHLTSFKKYLFKSSIKAKKILGTIPKKLSEYEIIYLYKDIEKYIEKNYKTSFREKSSRIRTIINAANIAISNGQGISEVIFDTQWPYEKKEITKKSGLINFRKLVLTEFETENEACEKILEEMKYDLKSIEDACWKIIDQFNEGRKLLKKALNDGAIKYKEILYRSRIYKKYKNSWEKTGHLIAYFYKKKWYQYDNFLPHILSKMTPTNHINTIKAFSRYRSSDIRKCIGLDLSMTETLLSIHYLPRIVIEAAEILFLIKTGWNIDTVLSITANTIKKIPEINPERYVLVGIKGKVDKTYIKPVFKEKNDDRKLFKLIWMLIENSKRIDRCWVRESKSIFVSPPARSRIGGTTGYLGKTYAADINRTLGFFKKIKRDFNLPDFNKKDIRDQFNTIIMIESQDIFEVQNLMGHAMICTTEAYVNQHALKLINEMNIKRFSDRLAATTIFMFYGETGLNNKDLKRADVDEYLLFAPVESDESERKSIVDDWLKSKGTLKIEIGNNEIQHLLFQEEYYRRNFYKLKSGNSRRFLIYHVPRIVFTIALRRTIEISKYGYLLNELNWKQNA